MACVEFYITQLTIAQQLHKQKSERLKNTTLLNNGSNSSVIWIECQMQLFSSRFMWEFV